MNNVTINSKGEFEVQSPKTTYKCKIDVVLDKLNDAPILQLYDLATGPKLAVTYNDLISNEISCNTPPALRKVITDAIKKNWFANCNIGEVTIPASWLFLMYSKWQALTNFYVRKFTHPEQLWLGGSDFVYTTAGQFAGTLGLSNDPGLFYLIVKGVQLMPPSCTKEELFSQIISDKFPEVYTNFNTDISNIYKAYLINFCWPIKKE